MLVSNIVKKEILREVQSNTLKEIRNSLERSFGPMGSNTEMCKTAGSNGNGELYVEYTKDGHTILQNLVFSDVIEQSVAKDLVKVTRNVVKEVGDGTTSAIILSEILFNELKALENNSAPYALIQQFKDAVKDISEEIKKNIQEFTPQKAYDISLISTNGNEEVANNIKDIYEKYGNDVYIDVAISNTADSLLKSYDGMTLPVGYSDTAYINTKQGLSSLRNPRIYAFDDPIDTPEMMVLLDKIIDENITSHYDDRKSNEPPVPTVILASKISRDMSGFIEKVVNFLLNFNNELLSQKPPLLVVTNINNREQFVDIVRLCGCKPIKKYINPDQQELDIKKGLAPTLETVTEFYGSADLVESDLDKTKFINPAKMLVNGQPSEEYKSLLSFLEAELQNAYSNNDNNNVTGTLKRRINSLKANMVDYLVGGVSIIDRDSLRALVEDSVLNCRSAAQYGVGYGANFEGLRASYKLRDKSDMHKAIFNAYMALSTILYNSVFHDMGESEKYIDISMNQGTPMNLRTSEFDGKVLCSIRTDMVILDTISKIVSIMFTTNQFLCPLPSMNKYLFGN